MAKRIFFPIPVPKLRAGLSASILIAGLMASSLASAQVTGSTTTGTDQQGTPTETVTVAAPLQKQKKEKVVQSKDTKKAFARTKKTQSDTLEGKDAKLPDKQLYDKAQIAIKKGRFDIARLDLQTLLNTYPDSEYQMRSKLAIADSWYREGGTAALTQAESEYKDFITFFPNAPEAAEAQMRVGDIYFRQMDKPDRDYAKAVHAEEEYRLMLQQFPESKLVPQAKQRLREVQEVLATRESDIALFYSTRENWPATIARYQTVEDTYPLYSHMDDVLVSLGDAWGAEARYVRTLKQLPEAAKANLERIYDERSAAAYRKVVLEHSASAHVEDAKDRLQAMGQEIPTPTAEQVAASNALENSRGAYTLFGRTKLLVLHTPDVIATARAGEPTLADPNPTLAPAIRKTIIADFDTSINPKAVTGAPAGGGTAAAAPDGTAPAAAPAPAPAALTLSDVPAAGAGGSTSDSTIMTAAPAGGSGGAGSSAGIEIVSPPAAARAVDTGGLPIAAPANATPLPAVEKAGAAPDAINDIQPGQAPAAQTGAANGKNKKPEFDKSDESSSKHKKKKGLKKLDPLPQ
jgi:outer membrane protein assembly factor BamD